VADEKRFRRGRWKALRDPKRGLAWLKTEELDVLRERYLLESDEHKLQAFPLLVQKRFLEERSGRRNKFEYRPYATRIRPE
jgi:hypothetical protein